MITSCLHFAKSLIMQLSCGRFLKKISTVHGNLSTSNNNMYGAPTNINNDDGNCGDSGGGVINDVNV